MRALIQRVSSASVVIDGQEISRIGTGLMILLGAGSDDDEITCAKLWNKVRKLRIFPDADGKTNLDLAAVGGSVLIVSQFTLFANCRRGNRPSFIEAADPETGNRLYELFVSLAKKDVDVVQTGEFGASMDVTLTNSGPFTIWLDTDEF
ncbi:MAG: D-tyrosyl-tRNA(Tyr) deacylase [Clostridiaceae bacterium]|jgi:D-tyrosyl-tRNA(Tyr) deacylase|nr:D-tyrosyl-tRNA(Tyr) deacylase [Clostridiaceae bacterium]